MMSTLFLLLSFASDRVQPTLLRDYFLIQVPSAEVVTSTSGFIYRWKKFQFKKPRLVFPQITGVVLQSHLN